MEKSLDFSWPSSSAHPHPNKMDTIKLKNKSLKTVIAIICIILLFLAASIFVYFDKENIKLRFQIIHSETVERLNSNKLIACDFEKNHTKAIEQELLKKIEKLNESEKNEKELSNKLQFEINNIQIQLNKERLNSTKYNNESSYLKKDNEELHSKIEKLERLSASRTMKTEKPNTVPFNCNENDIIKNLENENQKLKDDVNNLNKRYEEKFYAGDNKAASISDVNPNNGIKSWISNLVACFYNA